MRRWSLPCACALVLAACASEKHVYKVREVTREGSLDFFGWIVKLPPGERWTVAEFSDGSKNIHRTFPGPRMELVPFTDSNSGGCTAALLRRWEDSGKRATVEHEPYYLPASFAPDAVAFVTRVPWRAVGCHERAPGKLLVVQITAPGAPSSEDSRSLRAVLDALTVAARAP